MQMAASPVGRGRLASEPSQRVTEQPASTTPGGSAAAVGAAVPAANQNASAQPGRAADGRSSQPGDQGGKDSFSGVRQETELTEEERKQVEELKARDQEVRTHESAHKSAGGQYVRGSASFTYQTGPDGKRYAIGGEVKIDTGKEDDPQKTLEKAEAIRRAAMAPAEPSNKDRQVAADAARMATEARMEISRSSTEAAATGEVAGEGGEPGGASAGGGVAGRSDGAPGSSDERGGPGTQRRTAAGSGGVYGALNQFNLTASAGRSNNLFVNVYA
ncbi:hypothetical protein JCM17961_10940 [Endothiovibrio diazotrophicus]